MRTDPHVVWIASKRWEDHGIDQRMTAEMQRHARLLWVDPPVSLAIPARRRYRAARAPRPALTELSDRLARLTPAALPGLTRPGVRATTAPLLRAQIRWAMRQAGIEPFAVVTTSLQDVLGGWGDGVVSVLHGTGDYLPGAKLMGLPARRLLARERASLARADVVTALSPLLAQRWSAIRGSLVPLVPDGCTPAPDPLGEIPGAVAGLPRPVVGLVGRLNARIDLGLVEAIADAGFSLLVVGPHDPRWEPRRFAALTSRPGVRYAGRVPEQAAPSYAAAADVGITPYLDTPFNRASFPLKTLDYLSAGRPAVSTDLPASRWLREDLASSMPGCDPDQLLAVATSRAGFIQAIRQLAGDPASPARCRAFAARHTWASRADTLAAAIGLPRPLAGPAAAKDALAPRCH
ncbi:MAG TPA: glycosyltransferase [Streptosporangiaceae bacterium]|jgi:teichuronic acid biosynthesis glycosyltransferase TuaH